MKTWQYDIVYCHGNGFTLYIDINGSIEVLKTKQKYLYFYMIQYKSKHHDQYYILCLTIHVHNATAWNFTGLILVHVHALSILQAS